MTIDQHRQILRLARTGNPVRAWSVFQSSGLEHVADDPKALTLKGRLLKDLASFASGNRRVDLLMQAAEAYLAANAIAQDSYALINAAALACFAGDHERSVALAQSVLDLIESNPSEGETAYWREATRAEALLLLDQLDDAKEALAAGVAKLPLAHEDQAATIGQFERILSTKQGEADWLDQFRPPAALYFSGIIGLDPADQAVRIAIEDAVKRITPGCAFGALAAGADIMIAEAALEVGTDLHVVLPESVVDFRARSVEPSGGDWPTRFDALIDQAENVETLRTSQPEDGADFSYAVYMASLLAMGLCLRRASALSTKAHALTLAVSAEPVRPPIKRWLALSQPITHIDVQRSEPPRPAAPDMGYHPAVHGYLTVTGRFGEDVLAWAGNHELATQTEGDATLFSGPASSIVTFLHELLKDLGETVSGAFLFSAQDRLVADSADGRVASQLGRAALAGHCLSDRQSAFAARVLNPDLRIECAGEVQSLDGPIEVWSIAV